MALGGGLADFLPEGKEGRRKDTRDLLAELKGKGRTIVRSKTELAETPVFGTASLLGLGRRPVDGIKLDRRFVEGLPEGFLLAEPMSASDLIAC